MEDEILFWSFFIIIVAAYFVQIIATVKKTKKRSCLFDKKLAELERQLRDKYGHG
jgi:hypothetical protein